MPQTLIDPAEIIAGSWRNLYRNWMLYAEFTVWIVAVAIVYWVFSVYTRFYVPDRLTSTVLFSLLTLPLSLIIGVVIIAVTDATAKLLQNQKATAQDSLFTGLHHLLSFVWISILITLMLILGLALLVVPAVIFAVWYAFATDHLIIDGVRGTEAMARSKALVAGRWWAVCLRIVIPWLFFYFAAKFALALFYLLLGAVLGDPGMFFGSIPDITAVTSWHLLATTVVPQIFYGLSMPLYVAANLLLWFNLKKKPAVK